MARRTPWHSVLRNPPPKAHIIFWSDGSYECDEGIEQWLRGAVERNDLAMLLLPRAELRELRRRMEARGYDLDRLVDEGHLIRSATEDLDLHGPGDLGKLPELGLILFEIAKSVGRSGLSIVGAVGPGFFEDGNYRMAGLLESGGGSSSTMRVLCVYPTKALRPDRFPEAIKLTRMHSHAITAIGGGHFFVEEIGPLVEA